MLHDMSLTEKYAVIYDLPVRFDLDMAMTGTALPYAWRPGAVVSSAVCRAVAVRRGPGMVRRAMCAGSRSSSATCSTR